MMYVRIVIERIQIFLFQLDHTLLIVLTGFFQDVLDFRHRNNREEFREQEITGKEQSECTQVETNFPDGGCIVSTPVTGYIIAVNRGNNDHKALEPHTNVHDHRHEEGDYQVPAQFAEPEDLR